MHKHFKLRILCTFLWPNDRSVYYCKVINTWKELKAYVVVTFVCTSNGWLFKAVYGT